jgi:uncharacterized protein
MPEATAAIEVEGMGRDIVWNWCDRPGLEHLSLDIAPDAIRADGLVMVQLAPEWLRVAYTVELDGGWNFRHVRITVERDGVSRLLELERAADGRWLADGCVRPDLAECADIDIMATPFTNSLPIRRLAFEPGQPQTLQVAYIRLPDLIVESVTQDYTKLAAGQFRYHSRASGFTADLTIDGDGLVLDYGDIWRRRSGRG